MRSGRDLPRAFWETGAAWADLCHVLINMKEFIFID